jgi:phage repressor protein C with HTH and peptisase S24 domain
MGWAQHYIADLKLGKQVSFRPRGNSMKPRIKSGQLCTVDPVDPTELQPGDVVLCKVRGAEYLHLVKAVRDGQFQIGNAHGHVNGWVGASAIFGRLVSVED